VNTELSDDAVTKDYADKAPGIAKVHVVATVPTAKAFASFMSKFSDAVIRLTLLRLPLMQKKAYENLKQKEMEQFGNEAKRWVEEMRQYNVAAVHNPQRWDAIRGNYEFEQKRHLAAIEEYKKVVLDRQRDHMQILKAALAESAELQGLIKPIVVAVRSELDLAIDEKAYAEVLDEAAARNQARMKEYFEGLAKLLPTENPSPVSPTLPHRDA
jgi:hypothetical protein